MLFFKKKEIRSQRLPQGYFFFFLTSAVGRNFYHLRSERPQLKWIFWSRGVGDMKVNNLILGKLNMRWPLGSGSVGR